MPCYSPPPSYEADQREDMKQAARLLCAQVGKALRAGETVPEDQLRWFLQHRKIDKHRAAYFGEAPDAAIDEDIRTANRLLGVEPQVQALQALLVSLGAPKAVRDALAGNTEDTVWLTTFSNEHPRAVDWLAAKLPLDSALLNGLLGRVQDNSYAHIVATRRGWRRK